MEIQSPTSQQKSPKVAKGSEQVSRHKQLYCQSHLSKNRGSKLPASTAGFTCKPSATGQPLLPQPRFQPGLGRRRLMHSDPRRHRTCPPLRLPGRVEQVRNVLPFSSHNSEQLSRSPWRASSAFRELNRQHGSGKSPCRRAKRALPRASATPAAFHTRGKLFPSRSRRVLQARVTSDHKPRTRFSCG